MKKISLPLTEKQIEELGAGDEVLLSGTIYTARDQAQKRMVELIKRGRRLPIDLRGQVLYYCGPTRTPKGKIVGSCGPTTASRMDKFTPVLLRAGLRAMIGKGSRAEEVVKAIKRHKAVYFITMAGCGALLASKVQRAKPRAFKDLGPEAIYEFRVRDFPLIVAVDSGGKNIYPKRS